MADQSWPDPARADVAVIIPAYNAAATIGAAVASALAEPEVREVVVVDDASQDATPEAAASADDGSGRLAVHRLTANGGPSRARNVALSRSSAPVVAILNSDDRILAGRFRRLLAIPHWDLIADNMVFVASPEAADEAARRYADAPVRAATTSLDLATFVRGNVGKPGMLRREMGFIHPLMRRAFLDRHAIRYNEAMRLGEDFDLYARTLLADARFLLCATPGYLAVEREDSLSARHRVEDLAAFLACHDALERTRPLTRAEAAALALHRRSVAGRHALRRVLATKTERGMTAAAAWLALRPRAWSPVVSGIARDKLAARRSRRGTTGRGDDTRAVTLFETPSSHGRTFDTPHLDRAASAPRAGARLAGETP